VTVSDGPAMHPRHLARYRRDLGWPDPPPLTTAPAVVLADDLARSGDSLETLASAAAACTRCRLSETRRSVVFGEGSPTPTVLFVGEGPGAEEDQTGRPFVGEAGRLLEAMLAALGWRRDQVYIANVVKCRPPGNRDPEEDEMTACASFLERQIELLEPRVIVALGRFAARRLIGSQGSLASMRGRWFSMRGIPLLVTYHPAYLLRTPADKRLAWADLKVLAARVAELSPGLPSGVMPAGDTGSGD